MRHAALSVILASAVLSGPAASNPTSEHFTSKIGIHLLCSYTPGARKIIESDCPVIKVVDTHRDMLDAVRDYKTLHPNGIVVLRCYTPIQHSVSQNPNVRARLFWNEVLWPQLSRLTEQQKKWIDYVEGPNECETPCWRNVGEANWVTQFYLTLISLMRDHGFKPCIANIPVGNPPGPADEVEAKIRAFVPALRLAKEAGGCWSYHSYTLKYTQDPEIEIDYSLRYRRFYATLRKYAPDVADIPMILTEGGVDSDGTHGDCPGWKRDTQQKYQDWLRWFDSEIKKDHYILGITLFQIGDPAGWGSFDLEPLADWLAEYLRK